MAARGDMPERRGWKVRAVRGGAAVLLLAAGTLAAIVVAEWPGIVGPNTHNLEVAAAKTPAAAEAGGPDTARFFQFGDPDEGSPAWVRIAAAGRAEEARRDALDRIAAEESALARLKPRGEVDMTRTGREGADPDIERAVHDAWRRASSDAGQGERPPSLNEITTFDPTRTSATLRVAPAIDVTAGVTRYNTGDSPNVGVVENADGTRPRGETEVYDFSVRFDTLGSASVPPEVRALELGLIGGLRAASLFDQAVGDNALRDPVPVLGGDARWAWSKNSMVRASALGEAPGSDRDYLDLRLEQVWRFGGDASLSLGWRHLRGILTNEQPEPTLRQDAILLELKIGF